MQDIVITRRDKSTDKFLFIFRFYKSVFPSSEPIQITHINIFDSATSRKISWRGSRWKKKGKDVESQTRKILLLKMLQFIVARWSHPRRIAVAFREVYLHFAKQNACRVLFSPPLFLYYSHEVHTLSVRSAFCRQRAQRVNKKKGHSFRPFWRRWDANTAVSFSLVLFFSLTLPQISILSLFPWLWISAVDN